MSNRGDKKAQTLAALNQHWDTWHQSITAHDLASRLGYTTSYVHGVLHSLALSGQVTVDIKVGRYGAKQFYPLAEAERQARNVLIEDTDPVDTDWYSPDGY